GDVALIDHLGRVALAEDPLELLGLGDRTGVGTRCRRGPGAGSGDKQADHAEAADEDDRKTTEERAHQRPTLPGRRRRSHAAPSPGSRIRAKSSATASHPKAVRSARRSALTSVGLANTSAAAAVPSSTTGCPVSGSTAGGAS